MHAFLVTAGFEEALLGEMTRVPSPAHPRVLGPGIVTSTDGGSPPDDFVFARQHLPRAEQVAGASIAAMAEAAFRRIETTVDAFPGPWALHAIAAETPDDERGLTRRVALIGERVIALFRQRRRRASRRCKDGSTLDPNRSGWLLAQVLLHDRGRALVSAAAARPLPTGGVDLSPFPGGAAPVEIDRAPPSRAYLKLEEAFRWMGAAPAADETCVDLGASPGGWTLTALRRGARVVAVDRAPLDPPAAGHTRVASVIGNAFTYLPPQPVAWLLCDVICEPRRTIDLIERWLRDGLCRNAVVTIKFKGRTGYGVLADLPPLFARHGVAWWRVKHLVHNKNEVTVMLRR